MNKRLGGVDLMGNGYKDADHL